MRTGKRLLCLVFAALLLLGLAPERAVAADTVYFTAVNDQLLPLGDDTMPFWSGGMLYVASSTFDGNDLNIYYSRSRDKQTAVLYTQRHNAMICDFAAKTIYDSTSEQLLGGFALERGGVVFLPLRVVCSFFGLEYSTLRVSYGYLVRVKSASAVLSDASFLDAASAAMAQRYARYQRAKEPETTVPGTTEPSGGPTPPPPSPRTVYLVFEAADSAGAAQALDTVGSGCAAFLFAPHGIPGAGDLLRRLAAGAGSIVLRVDGSGGAENTLAQIVDGNEALWAAANVKTRLVHLDGADEETERAVADAGYCPLRYALDYGDAASVSRMSARILSAADANGGSCCVFLGTDAAAAGSLRSLLLALHTGNCTPVRLNETVALRS